MGYSQPLWKLAACSLALAACAPDIGGQDVGFLPAPQAEESTLVVRNEYFGELDVFFINGSTRTRIGAVPTGASARFRIPRWMLIRPEIQFQLDPVGPIAPFTYRPIAVGPGNLIELSAAPALQMSSYAIVIRP